MCTYCKVLQYIAIMTSSMLKSSFATIHTRTFSYFLASLLAALETQAAGSGGSCWSWTQSHECGCWPEVDRGHLGSKHVAVVSRMSYLSGARMTAYKCLCSKLRFSSVQRWSERSFFFFLSPPPRFCLFVFYWLASQANLSAQPLTD